MLEHERQALWLKLQREKAEILERQAVADAEADLTSSRRLTDRLGTIDHALRALKEAMAIRTMLAKIDAIGED